MAAVTEKPSGLRTYRQSLLAGFETCPRRTWFGLQNPDDLTTGFVEATGDLGSALHLVCAEILHTLHRQGEVQMSTQESVEVMYEVLAAGNIVLPAEERETLRHLILRFAGHEWNPSRFLAIEEHLEMEIACQDGVVRTLTGRPDLLIADPPDGIIIVDYKSGWAPPRQPRKPPPEGEVVTGKQYLSDRGHYQLDTYGLLGLNRYPRAQRAILRELQLRSGDVREAVLGRDELEHVERELGVQMMLLDRGITEGAESGIWRPRPGHHCLRQCPVARSCPVPQEQRGLGSIDSHEDADEAAGRFAVVDGLRQQLRDQLKAVYEQTGYAPQIGDGRVLRWKDKPDGKGRTFGMHEPAEPVEDVDFAPLLEASIYEAQARRKGRDT